MRALTRRLNREAAASKSYLTWLCSTTRKLLLAGTISLGRLLARVPKGLLRCAPTSSFAPRALQRRRCGAVRAHLNTVVRLARRGPRRPPAHAAQTRRLRLAFGCRLQQIQK